MVYVFAAWLSFFLVVYCLSRLEVFLGNTCTFNFSKTGCKHRLFNCGGNNPITLQCPFQVKDDPYHCGHSDFKLSCEHNRTVIYVSSEKYFLEENSINYTSRSFHVVDPGMQKNNCSTLPLYSFRYRSLASIRLYYGVDTDVVVFVSCKNPVVKTKKSPPLYVDTAPCLTAAKDDYSYNYVVVGKNLVASDIEETCTVLKKFPADLRSLDIGRENVSFQDIHNLLANGFEFEWFEGSKDSFFNFISMAVPFFELAFAGRTVIGIIFLFAFLIYKWHRRHLSKYDTIEEFLQKNNSLMPIRYSYKEIKTMTNNFKDKLGEGGYAIVYKGKLRSGNLVAVKMLKKSKAKNNGQEFINEIGTIGRIHHVNVVRLVGFCFTTSKRALVYDYMPNGSLDKFIFSLDHPNREPLSWKKAFDIAMGVARGIEYLHQGCNMRILHFDIKPHNILVDENFIPKVSDFGLAKLYPLHNSVASLTAIRGTLGYMAPELFYKTIGAISHKVDIYSFGMLLLEMAGRRRNVNGQAERSSQIYYPSWIYDKFDLGEEFDVGNITEEDMKIARKLILVAFWCIQMTPTDRPSMREVLEMLAGDLDALQLPPKPLFYPPNSTIHAQRSSHCTTFSEEYSTETEPLCDSMALEIEIE
ncbi:hypothetical protein ACH5RR_040479 [Cinchona calisaya]|uniref:Protein kinase domain-containing protein n=1 Tax=Cinchona calisaya TaxID=153742 RepID=A0ABD2XW04_9GENT